MLVGTVKTGDSCIIALAAYAPRDVSFSFHGSVTLFLAYRTCGLLQETADTDNTRHRHIPLSYYAPSNEMRLYEISKQFAIAIHDMTEQSGYGD